MTTPLTTKPPQYRHRRRPGWWPSNIVEQLRTVLTIDQRTRDYVGVIDTSVTRSLQGLSGHVPIGNSAAPAFRWNGYTSYGQLALSGAIPASRNLRGSPATALPATAGPVVITSQSPVNTVMNALAAMPPGAR